jgi:hypothetical protein
MVQSILNDKAHADRAKEFEDALELAYTDELCPTI